MNPNCNDQSKLSEKANLGYNEEFNEELFTFTNKIP